jgi:acetyltransferase-like isoleucine patch superfamily enzyme
MRLWLRYRRIGIEAVNTRLATTTSGVRTTLERYGARIGPLGVFSGPLIIENANGDYHNLIIGTDVHVGRGVLLDIAAPLTLEDQAVVSMGATLLTHFSTGNRPLREILPERLLPLTIGRGSYIGANATILAGCDIGAAAIVGAGALVTKPVPPGATVIGVPARELRINGRG